MTFMHFTFIFIYKYAEDLTVSEFYKNYVNVNCQQKLYIINSLIIICVCQMPNFIKVANKSDLNPGENKVVNANGTDVALFNVEGEFFAISNTCLHRGGPLGEGFLEGDVVSCPWHGWRFNVKTGQNVVMPNAKVACYKVKIEMNEVMVALD